MKESSITASPDIMMGKPVLRGTRITVEHVLEKLAHGESIEDIIGAHPRVTREMVLAAIDYAAQVMKSETVHLPTA